MDLDTNTRISATEIVIWTVLTMIAIAMAIIWYTPEHDNVSFAWAAVAVALSYVTIVLSIKFFRQR